MLEKAHGEKNFELGLEGWPGFDNVERAYSVTDSKEAPKWLIYEPDWRRVMCGQELEVEALRGQVPAPWEATWHREPCRMAQQNSETVLSQCLLPHRPLNRSVAQWWMLSKTAVPQSGPRDWPFKLPFSANLWERRERVWPNSNIKAIMIVNVPHWMNKLYR